MAINQSVLKWHVARFSYRLYAKIAFAFRVFRIEYTGNGILILTLVNVELVAKFKNPGGIFLNDTTKEMIIKFFGGMNL